MTLSSLRKVGSEVWLFWLGSVRRNLTRQLYLANSFIVLVSNNKILLGAQNGAQVISYKIFIIMFNELYSYSIPAFGTIGISIDVNGRLFLCLKSSIRKAFLAFSLNLSQPDSIYINLLMRVQLRVFPGSIMFVPTQNP